MFNQDSSYAPEVFGLLAVGAVFIYFVPSIVASSRFHWNSTAIFVLNLFLGWSFLGWVAALVWAMTDNRVPQDRWLARSKYEAQIYSFASLPVNLGLVLFFLFLMSRLSVHGWTGEWYIGLMILFGLLAGIFAFAPVFHLWHWSQKTNLRAASEGRLRHEKTLAWVEACIAKIQADLVDADPTNKDRLETVLECGRKLQALIRYDLDHGPYSSGDARQLSSTRWSEKPKIRLSAGRITPAYIWSGAKQLALITIGYFAIAAAGLGVFAWVSNDAVKMIGGYIGISCAAVGLIGFIAVSALVLFRLDLRDFFIPPVKFYCTYCTNDLATRGGISQVNCSVCGSVHLIEWTWHDEDHFCWDHVSRVVDENETALRMHDDLVDLYPTKLDLKKLKDVKELWRRAGL